MKKKSGFDWQNECSYKYQDWVTISENRTILTFRTLSQSFFNAVIFTFYLYNLSIFYGRSFYIWLYVFLFFRNFNIFFVLIFKLDVRECCCFEKLKKKLTKPVTENRLRKTRNSSNRFKEKTIRQVDFRSRFDVLFWVTSSWNQIVKVTRLSVFQETSNSEEVGYEYIELVSTLGMKVFFLT